MGFCYVPQAKACSLQSLITAIIPTWVERERGPGEGCSVRAGALGPDLALQQPSPRMGAKTLGFKQVA